MAEGNENGATTKQQANKSTRSRKKRELNTQEKRIMEALDTTSGLITDMTAKPASRAVSFNDLHNSTIPAEIALPTSSEEEEDWDESKSEINRELRNVLSQAENQAKKTQPETSKSLTTINISQTPGTSKTNNNERTMSAKMAASEANIAHTDKGVTQPVEVERITSKMLLTMEKTPFIQEEELDRFKANTYPLQKFIILRNLLGKIVRTHYNLINLRENIELGTIPPGMRANRESQVIDPDTTFTLKKMQICGDFENSLLQLTISHYEKIEPTQAAEFKTLWTSKTNLSAKENVLIRLKLAHYKNELIEQKETQRRIRKERREKKKQEEPTTTNPEPTTNENNWGQQRPQPQRPPRKQYNRNEQWNQGSEPWNRGKQ